MTSLIKVNIDPHALVRAGERGTNEEEIKETVRTGEKFPAKKRRSEFRQVFEYGRKWEGVHYEHKLLHVFCAPELNGWYVVTVIVEFF